jgi:hypothetical protein
MSSLLAHALKQEISLPVARLLVLVQTARQLLKLATGWGLYDGRARLQERFSSSLGQGPRLPREDSCTISLTVCSARMRDFFSFGFTPRWGPP